MSTKKFLLIAIIISFFIAQPALAYLDPGTGSILLQGLMASVIGALAVSKLYWRRLKNVFRRLLGKPPIPANESVNKKSENK